MRFLSSSFTCFNLARRRFRILLRNTRNLPFFLACPQMWVKPRKLNVSGLPSPCFFRLSAAKSPNSIRRVLSGCDTPAGVPSQPWQCSYADASPDACTDVSSLDEGALLLGLLPLISSATTNCLVCLCARVVAYHHWTPHTDS